MKMLIQILLVALLVGCASPFSSGLHALPGTIFPVHTTGGIGPLPGIQPDVDNFCFAVPRNQSFTPGFHRTPRLAVNSSNDV